MNTEQDQTYTLDDIRQAWTQAQDARQEYYRQARHYRHVLLCGVRAGVRQSHISRALGRHRESLRRDLTSAALEQDTPAVEA